MPGLGDGGAENRNKSLRPVWSSVFGIRLTPYAIFSLGFTFKHCRTSVESGRPFVRPSVVS